ncbi:MAG: DUF294 nucleotidyltransferase-like domain-containing protein [Rhodoferax sp.]|nr:DUF294 nucleotidyltransferase-like domain-containing protein [Rhodoferax sp.]
MPSLAESTVALDTRQSQYELQSLAMARVDAALVHPPHFVDAKTSILDVVKLFQAKRIGNVLVQDHSVDPPALGIFTGTGVQRAVLHGTPLDQLPVGALANFSLIKVRPGDLVGEALAAMIKHKVHKVVVAEGEQVTGVLEALDLFGFLSNQSYQIHEQILAATDVGALKRCGADITRLITLLHRNGTKVTMIARLVQELNLRLFERAWQLIAPADLVANSCLFVMGSEGRGEQLLKTDQDNGLVLRDGYVCSTDLGEVCQQFSAALADFGYPACPGNIMVSNPHWRQHVTEFSQMVRMWSVTASPDALMELAIFVDAHAVCGDASLLETVRASVFALTSANDAMLARFAAAINFFGNSSGWWNRLLTRGADEHLNLKKVGTFPLVHGIRSLALAHRLATVSTTDRIEALLAAGKLGEKLAADLTDSLHFFMGLKLKVGLQELEAGLPVSGAIDVEKLSTLDRDLLKDTLAVVKQFKVLLNQRFRLDYL